MSVQQHNNRDLSQRYGTKNTVTGRVSRLSSSQRKWLIGLGVAIMVIVSVWFTFAAYLPSVNHKDVGYNIISPTEAKVEFQVSKRPNDTVQCNIHVLNEVYAVVGHKTITIGPDTAKTSEDAPNSEVEGAIEIGQATSSDRYYVADLRTDSLGVTGIVDSCWVVDTNS